MDPAIADSLDDDICGRVHVDRHVDGDHLFQLRGLGRVAWEAVENEGGVGMVGIAVLGVEVGGDVDARVAAQSFVGGVGVEIDGGSDGVEGNGLDAVGGNEPAAGCEGVADQAQDHAIGDEGAGFHERFGLDACRVTLAIWHPRH